MDTSNSHSELNEPLPIDATEVSIYSMLMAGSVNWAITLGRHDMQHVLVSAPLSTSRQHHDTNVVAPRISWSRICKRPKLVLVQILWTMSTANKLVETPTPMATNQEEQAGMDVVARPGFPITFVDSAFLKMYSLHYAPTSLDGAVAYTDHWVFWVYWEPWLTF
jgi:hypothetical protein